MKITLQGNPISNNSLYKRGRGSSFYMTDEAKALKENYQWQIKQQYKKKPIKKKLTLMVKLYFKDKKRRDIDNWNKLVFDACNKILWEDDSQIMDLAIYKIYNASKSYIELEL